MSKKLILSDRKSSTLLKIPTNPKIQDDHELALSPHSKREEMILRQEQSKSITQPLQQTHSLKGLKQQVLQQNVNALSQALPQVKQTKTSLLLQSILQNVQKDIISAKVQIPEQPKEISQILHKKKHKLTLQKHPQLILTQSQVIDNEYKSLLRKKQDILDELREIEQTQNLIRKNLHDSTLQTSSSRQKLNKMPTLTEQDRQHWLKIKQIVKQHEENSKLIKQINNKKQQQQLKLQNQLQQKKKHEQSEEKRKVIEKNIMEIKKRHNQRSQQIKESHILIEKLKNKTKLYQKMEQNWQHLEHQLKSQNQAAFFDHYQNKRSINVREIKKYEEQYDAKMQQEEQKRRQKLQSSKITLPIQAFDRTKFSVNILQQAKRKKQIEQEKIHQIKQLISKRNEYATNIKQRYKSVSKLERINEKSKEKQNDKQTEEKKLSKDMRSMTALDIKNKGNQYMRSINSGLKIRSHSKNDIVNNKKGSQQVKHSYKNYLPQVMKRNDTKQGNANKPSDIQMLHSIITKEKASTEQKFYQVQRITKKMQNKGTQKQLLNSINAKIQLLNKLSLNNNTRQINNSN